MPSDPDRIGPYRVLGRLGAGGMGVVYRARRADQNHDVALKVVAGGDARARFALRREVRTLARLDHPGIVRVLDIRLDDVVPCYAMALVEGVPLHQTSFLASISAVTTQCDATRADAGLHDATTAELTGGHVPGTVQGTPVDLQRVARVFSRLCATLAFLHGEGLVHKDLKPSNVVLAAGDRPVLVDFGLATRFEGDAGRDALDLDAAGGTMGYVSPEQLRGEPVDARADIYALGCMLYQALTGSVPFTGPGAAVARAHLHQVPTAPSLRAAVPAEIDALVLAMLRKEPRERIGHADAVARALVAFSGPVDAANDLPRPRPYLYRSGLVGRAGALAWIEAQLDATRKGNGGVAVLEGASGLGKTRLALEAARLATERGLAVLTGRATGVGEVGAGPLYPLRATFEQLLDLDALSGLGERAAVLAPFFPVVVADHLPPPLPAPEARRRLIDAVVHTLRALAETRPTALVFDDLHDADDLTYDVLAGLGSASPGRLLVLATHRPEALRVARPPLGAGRTFALRPLDRAAVHDLVEQMLAERHAAAGSLLGFLAANAAGNPFFVAEYLRTAVATGVLALDGRGAWRVVGVDAIDLRLPSSLDALFAQRVDGLAGESRALAEIAAVLGVAIDRQLLAAAAELDEDRLEDGLRKLADRQILVESERGAGFVHAAVRERIYAAISAEPRRALHRAAIRALSRDGAPPELAALAMHHERAGDPETAGAMSLEAGREALRRYDLAGSERLLRDALRLATTPTVRIDAMFELGYRVLNPQGRNDETAALARAEIAEGTAAGLPALVSRAERTLGLLAIGDGRYEEAVVLLADTARRDRLRSDFRAIAFDTNNLGLALRMASRPAEALPVFEECRAAAQAAPGSVALSVALLGVGGALQDLGRLDEAGERYAEGLAIARQEGDPVAEGALLNNLAWLASARGDVETALDRYAEAIAVHRRARSWFGAAEALSARGRVLMAAGDLVGAGGAFREALTEYRGSWPVMEAQAQVHLAEVCWHLGDVTDVAPLLSRAGPTLATADAAVWGALCARADVLLAAVARKDGRFDEAATHLDAAARRLGPRVEADIAFAAERSALAAAGGDDLAAARWAAVEARCVAADPQGADMRWAAPRRG